MISIISSFVGFGVVTWFFFGLAWTLKKSPIITDLAAAPVWIIMIIGLGFLVYDVYLNFKKNINKKK
jgi:hypothetical protein